MRPEREMVGRVAERRELELLLQRAGGGSGGIALIGGEAGIGKTHLLREVTAASNLPHQTARVLEGQVSAYRVLLDLLRQSQAASANPILKSMIEGRTVSDEEAEAVPRALCEALLSLTKSSPAILILEDLHWADAATLELLPQLCSLLESRPLVMILTYRSDELDRNHLVRRLRTQLRRSPSVLDLQLKPLSLHDTGLLAEAVLGGPIGPILRRELQQRTSGMPFFIEELCRSLAGTPQLTSENNRFELRDDRSVPIPETLRDTLLQRVDELSEPGRSGLEAAAVAGAEFEMELLVSLGIEDAVIDELLESGLLMEFTRESGGFRHVLTREAVLDEIPWSRRRRLNAMLAPLMSRRGAPKRVVATHYQAAGQNEEARRIYLEDARESCQLHAYYDAEQSFQRALELWPEEDEALERLNCLERLAECAQVSGHLKESARVWRDVVHSEQLRDDPERLGKAWRSLAAVYSMQSAPQRALESRQSAYESFKMAGAHADAANEALTIAEADMLRLQLERGIQMAEVALEHARAAGDVGLEANATSLIGLGLAMQGRKVEARRKIEAGLQMALRNNTKEAASAAYQRMPYVYAYNADYHGLRDSFGSAIEFCDREALEDERSACLGCMAYAMMRVGNWKRAADVARDGLRSKDGKGMLGQLVLGMLAVFRGELKRARSNLIDADAEARNCGLAPVELITRGGLAMVDELSGEHASAARRYRDLLRFWERTEDRLDILLSLCRAATFFATRKESEDLNACAEIARRIASENAHPEALGTLSFILGEISLMEEHPGEAAPHFTQAREEFERSDLKLELALCDWRIGTALRENGEGERAVDHLRRSYREAKSLGARPLLATLTTLLGEQGEALTEERDPEAPTRTARGGLTQRQQEVAALIAKGLTNKEIAGSLGLSVRTIDMHVGNVLDRLDCRTRTEAVKKLVDLGVLK